MGIIDSEFKFAKYISTEDREAQARIDKIYIEAGVYTPEYVAKREGILDTDADGEVDSSSKEDYQDIVEQKSKGQRKGTYYKPLYE